MRVDPIEREQLGKESAALYAAIAGPRGGIVDGPFRVWLKTDAELAEAMNGVGTVLRTNGKLDKRLFEIAVLCVARFWDAHYQWAAHAPLALKLGLSQQTIDEIGRGSLPVSAPADEQLVFRLAMGLLEQRRIEDDLYSAVLDLIGFENMVELVTTVGQYSLAAIVTNGFDIRLLSGGPALPERQAP